MKRIGKFLLEEAKEEAYNKTQEEVNDMLEKQQLSELLEQAIQGGGDFAEIFEERKMTSAYSMLNGIVEDSTKNLRYGIGIRIYDGLSSVYAYTNQISMENLKKTIDALCDSIGKRKEPVSIVLEEVLYENAHPIQKIPSKASSQEKIALMRRANDAAFAYDPCIKKVITTYQDEEQHVAISNSDGKYIQDVRVRTRMAVNAIAEDGTLVQNGRQAPGAAKGLEFYDEVQPEEIGKEAARIAKVMLHAQDCPSGVMDVVIDNGFGGVIFHEACGHALEASSVAKNQSVFAHKIGEKIASDVVTAIDDGTIPNAWGSANIDDEGNFTKRNVLIEHGVLKSYLVDTLNGRRMQAPSTSSSRRESYRYEPTSRMSNTFIANGEHTLEELIQATEYGLYAKNLGGGSVDPSTGDYNFAVLEGYLIEHGKITKPCKGATLIGNGAKTLLDIDMVANNLKRAQGMCGASSGSIPTDVGQPAIRVRNMIVGGNEGGEHHE